MPTSRASVSALVHAARALTRSTSVMRTAFAAIILLVTASAASAAPEITTGSLPGATAGSAYSTTLAATNGTSPYTWSVADGSLPAGLSLDGGSGEISQASADLARRTEQHASELASVVEAVDALTTAVTTTAASAKVAHQDTRDAVAVAGEGTDIVRLAVSAMSSTRSPGCTSSASMTSVTPVWREVRC